MRLAKAQPPAALRVLGRATQELSEERGELFDGARQSFSGKERAQYRILVYTRIKCHREFAAGRGAANGLIQVVSSHKTSLARMQLPLRILAAGHRRRGAPSFESPEASR